MKAFRLVDMSSNTNSFGLRSCILVAQDGETWECYSNDLNRPTRDKDYRMNNEYPWARHGWECPHVLSNVPDRIKIQLVRSAWGTDPVVLPTPIKTLAKAAAKAVVALEEFRTLLDADRHYEGFSDEQQVSFYEDVSGVARMLTRLVDRLQKI